MDLSFKLQVFEGPLDLLLHLLDKNKVNIYDIPIVEITDQYMDYIRQLRENHLDVMSEFLVMAATLLDIKSRMLLPKQEVEDDEEDIDPRAELVQQLIEYKMYKTMSYELRDRQMDAVKVFYKDPTIPAEVLEFEQPINLDEIVGDMNLNKLNEIYKSVMKRREDRVDPVRSKFGKIEKEEISVEARMDYVRAFCMTNSKFSFRKLLESGTTKTQIVVTFLVVLELMKEGTIFVSQEDTFGDIYIESKIAA